MIAVDTNILVYAHRAESEWHDPAFDGVKRLAEGRASWAIPWPCLHEFLAIVTHPRIYDPATPIARAIEQVEAWLESPTVVTLSENEDHWASLCDLVRSARVVGPRIHDARIAALCRAHGVRELWTADRDFSAFPDLVARNPLIGDA